MRALSDSLWDLLSSMPWKNTMLASMMEEVRAIKIDNDLNKLIYI
jgi:hypothetical protein